MSYTLSSSQPLPAACYIRVSSEQQAKNGDSLREQAESLDAYLREHPQYYKYDTYIDEGASGQKLERDDFSRLMEDVRLGRIRLILFTKLDRWFRNLRHYLNTQAVLEEYRVNWLAVRQPYYDTTTPYGRAFVNQSMMWAELEAQNDSERILAVFENKVKYGEVLSGKVPIGYRIENKHLVLDANAPSVKKIFEYYADSGNLRATCSYAAALGFPMTSTNLKKSVLSNTKYAGIFRDNPHYCPALISPALFERVQLLLSRNLTSSQIYPYLFSGLLYCRECGSRLSGCQIYVRSPKGKRYRYPAYRCGQNANHKTCPNSGQVRESAVESNLLPLILPSLTCSLPRWEVSLQEKDVSLRENQRIRQRLARLRELYLGDFISLKDFQNEYNSLKSSLSSPSIPDISCQTSIRDFLSQDFSCIYQSLTPEEKRSFWRKIIYKVYISKSRDYQCLFL